MLRNSVTYNRSTSVKDFRILMHPEPYNIVEEFKLTYRHRVYFTHAVFDLANPILASTIQDICSSERPKVFIVADASLAQALPELQSQIEDYFDHNHATFELKACWTLPGGEALKNDANYLQNLYSEIDKHGLCRHSCIIAIGGGALLDMVGYAAATAHRGIRHLRLPTTSLSQSDGGCGVKNSVNFAGKKNFLGTFTPPDAIINDLSFLNTLPQERLIDGYIEAVKVALIKDAHFFASIEQQAEALAARDPEAIAHAIQTSARYHVMHITRSGDPFELTSSRPLDFGHWSAHKLEGMSAFRLSHGQAVAIGIALDCVYSCQKGILSETNLQRILSLIAKLGFQCYDEALTIQSARGDYQVLRGLEEFREHLGGKLTIPLLRDIGDQIEVNEMDFDVLAKSIDLLKSYALEHAG